MTHRQTYRKGDSKRSNSPCPLYFCDNSTMMFAFSEYESVGDSFEVNSVIISTAVSPQPEGRLASPLKSVWKNLKVSLIL